MRDNKEISSAFKATRQRMEMSQERMAEYLGMGRAKYSSYEEGRAAPRISEFIQIVNRLGFLTIEEFMGGINFKSKESPVEKAYRKLSPTKKEIVDFILKLK